jgi:hypothetical protein
MINHNSLGHGATGAALTLGGRTRKMKRNHLWSGLALGALALAVWGCAAEAPTSPGSPEGASFARATTVTGYSSASDPALLAWYDSEKARVAAAAITEAPLYDALVASMPPGNSWVNQASKNGVAQCYPQQYAADVQIIGPDGGQLTVGNHSFTVPPKALSKYYVITAEAHAQAQVGLEFSPEGLGFAKAAVVKLSYAQCAFPDGVTKSVVYTDDRWNIKEYEPTADDVANKLLGGNIVHFSQYAVAW